MSKNILQIFTTNPASSMQNTDLLYLGRSPFGVNSDFGITWANMVASIIAQGAGGSNTQVQYNNNGALAGDAGFTTNGNGTLVASTSLSIANINLSASTITTLSTDSNLIIDPNGDGIVLVNTASAFTTLGNGNLQVINPSTLVGAIAVANYGTSGGAAGGNINLFRSRAASVGSHVAVINNDILGRVQSFADDGTTFVLNGFAEWIVNGAVSTGIVPSQYIVQTTNSSGVMANVIRADNTGFVCNAISAPSINFGGSTLQTYANGITWSPLPTITAATQGDLSVAYTVQTATYTKVGHLVFVNIALTFTPTYTTASGNMQISNFPFAASATGFSINVLSSSSSMTWPAGRTTMCGALLSGTTTMVFSCFGSAVNASNFPITGIVSGSATAITLAGFYRTNTA